jgi:error-prone DNA polymerase
VPGAWTQIEHELEVIGALGFAGYFLVVWDIAQVCRRLDIYCQGRGSAANSAVCYALGVTNVDAVDLGLLFERFLSPARDGPPDIDVDIESGRREEVIQYVYERYGRRHAAQVANVITYRPRSAVRDVGKAFGFTPEQVDGWAAGIDRVSRGAAAARGGGGGGRWWGRGDPAAGGRAGRRGAGPPAPPGHPLGGHGAVRPAGDRGLPRGVGAHARAQRAAVGQGRLCRHRAGEVRPARAGHARGAAPHGRPGGPVPRGHRRPGPAAPGAAVYDLLCRADTVGVFQVESRAQMGTLPRVQPRCFYDLAIEVALIRPGPIQGHAVNPYIRRRRGEEEVTYLHPLLEPILERTLGVPLFQEQLMEMAVAIAGFSAAEADELRQAMAAKRSAARMEKMRARLYAGMAERGGGGEVADQIFAALAAFANFGFPESHSVSFAHLVYASSWLKLHYPAAFTAGLLNSQPMGFWSPQSLVADARRHGVAVRRPHVNRSEVGASLEAPGLADRGRGPVGPGAATGAGLGARRGETTAERIVAGRPWSGGEDLVRRAGVSRAQLETLAAAGALDAEEHATAASRRRLLWAAGAAAQGTPDRLPGIVVGAEAPPLPEPTLYDSVGDDLWALGLAPERTAMHLARERLEAMGVVVAATFRVCTDGDRVSWPGW